MDIPVLVTRLADGTYQAEAPFSLRAMGANEVDALEALRRLIRSLPDKGARLVRLEIDTPSSLAFLDIAGSLDPNDPLVIEWHAILEENRRKANEDPNF